jgi:hypothetical protein
MRGVERDLEDVRGRGFRMHRILVRGTVDQRCGRGTLFGRCDALRRRCDRLERIGGRRY